VFARVSAPSNGPLVRQISFLSPFFPKALRFAPLSSSCLFYFPFRIAMYTSGRAFYFLINIVIVVINGATRRDARRGKFALGMGDLSRAATATQRSKLILFLPLRCWTLFFFFVYFNFFISSFFLFFFFFYPPSFLFAPGLSDPGDAVAPSSNGAPTVKISQDFLGLAGLIFY
jgi:hypothetical protein